MLERNLTMQPRVVRWVSTSEGLDGNWPCTTRTCCPAASASARVDCRGVHGRPSPDRRDLRRPCRSNSPCWYTSNWVPTAMTSADPAVTRNGRVGSCATSKITWPLDFDPRP
jgi:hypothetical protein